MLLAGLAFPLAYIGTNSTASSDAPHFLPVAQAGVQSVSTSRFERAYTEMRYRLTPDDLNRYRALFSAVDLSNWRFVDSALGQIGDRRLLGHVLAERYLLPDSHPTFAALRSWLDLYSDLPQAGRIYGLAQAKKPADVVADLPKPRGGNATSGEKSVDPDTIGSAEPHTDAGARAVSRFFAADNKTALNEAGRAIAQLGNKASNSLWIAGLAAWRLGQFTEAGRHFAALAHSTSAPGRLVAAGAYWAGRVDEITGKTSAGNKWFGEASRFRTTFYGMLAMRKLGLDIAQEISAASLSADHLDTLAETPAGYRAIALLQIGRRDLAARELERIDPSGDPKMEEALIVVADAAHLGDISPSLAQRIANPADDAVTHFPIPAWHPRGGFHVDPALVYAVARQESKFDPNAVSPAGAAGLMQIMPGTADALGGANKSLLDPANSLDLGQRYIRNLMADPRIGENLLLLALAYNGGSGNPAKFQHVLDCGDPLLAIEGISNEETRGFVERVLANYWIYRARLGYDTASLTDLANGRWPKYRWDDATTETRPAKFVD
jgi:soluble lytic murein transglycosylase-like protein